VLANVIDALFGCSHRHYTFPLTVRSRRNAATALTGTYVVCLECGKEFPYDWEQMRMITSLPGKTRSVAGLASKHAA
jgi:hypothetical protein